MSTAGSMATCARSSSSSGGAQPPPNPNKRLHSQCEASQEKRKKGRGQANGEAIAHFVAIKGRIKPSFDIVGKTYKVIGPYAAWYDSAVGIHTRFCCDPSYEKWKDVPMEQKAKVKEGILAWFDIDFSGILRGVLYRDAGKCYKAWKHELAGKFKHCESIDQALVKAQYLEEKTNPATKEPYSLIDNWKDMRMRNGIWTNQEAEQRYEKMNLERTSQIAQFGSADERSILRNSHPQHRGRLVGIGPTLPLFWLNFAEESSSSTDTSTTSSMEDRARIRRLEETVLDLVDVIRQLAPDRLPARYGSTANDDFDESVEGGN